MSGNVLLAAGLTNDTFPSRSASTMGLGFIRGNEANSASLSAARLASSMSVQVPTQRMIRPQPSHTGLPWMRNQRSDSATAANCARKFSFSSCNCCLVFARVLLMDCPRF